MLVYDLSAEIKNILDESRVEYVYHDGRYGKAYLVDTDNIRLEVTIDPRWIGYDFELKHKISGRTISSSVDTDNYPLTPNFEAGNRGVYNTTKRFLTALLAGKIFVGLYDDNPATAIPDEEPGNYILIVHKRFLAKKKTVTLEQLLASGSMQPVER